MIHHDGSGPLCDGKATLSDDEPGNLFWGFVYKRY